MVERVYLRGGDIVGGTGGGTGRRPLKKTTAGTGDVRHASNNLHHAVLANDSSSIKLWFMICRDSSRAGSEQPNAGLHAVHLAVKENKLEALKTLLNAGADANTVDVWGHVPLFYTYNVEYAQVLIEHGADVNGPIPAWNHPLRYSGSQGYIGDRYGPTMRRNTKLLELYVNNGFSDPAAVRELLKSAVRSGDVKVTELLIDKLEAKDWDDVYWESEPRCRAFLDAYQEKHEPDKTSKDSDKSPEKEPDSLHDLSNRFLKAFQQGKADEWKALWTTPEQMRPLYQRLIENGRTKKERAEKTLNSFDKRNEEIVTRITDLLEILKSNGYDVKKFSLIKATGQIQAKTPMGVPRTKSLEMQFKYDEKTILKLQVPELYKIDGKWVFTHYPPNNMWIVVRDGKTEILYVKSTSR